MIFIGKIIIIFLVGLLAYCLVKLIFDDLKRIIWESLK